MKIFATFVLLSVYLALPLTRAAALPKYATAEGVPCAYCHVNAAGGGARNYRGVFYRMNQHSFAGFDDAAEAKKKEVPVGPNADLKPASLTAAAAPVNLVSPIISTTTWKLTPDETAAIASVTGDTVKIAVPTQPEKYLQFAHNFSAPLVNGAELTIRFWAKANVPYKLLLVAQRSSFSDNDYAPIGLAEEVEIGTEEKEYVVPWVVQSPHAKRNKIAFVLRAVTPDPKPLTLFLRNVRVLAPAVPPPTAVKPGLPPIAFVDPQTLPDFGRWQDPVSRLWFVKIPAGSFRRGTTDAQADALKKAGLWSPQNTDEQPARTVQIGRPFLLGATEVTQSDWKRIMAEVQKGSIASPSAFKGDDRPVDSVSFADAQLFCRTLREVSGVKAFYRLPSEAEWEYAARAGSDDLFPLGADHQPITPDTLKNYAWMNGTAPNATGKAGGKLPNAWGLYDTMGNVWEWCADAYSPTAYTTLPDKNPLFSSPNATERVLRGGCWFLDTKAQRPALRGGNLPTFKSQYVGLRVVREL